MTEKCPLCGGTLAGNICEFCGYALPREEELAAFYNFDPADYPQENAVREIIPEHISEEIYPNRAESRKPIEVKVREETAVQPIPRLTPTPKPSSVPMRYNMPAASPNRVRNVQNVQYIQNVQPPQSMSEFLWGIWENLWENFRKCWTLLPLCYFFPHCIVIYFVVAGVRLFSGEKVSVPFGLLTAAAALLGFLGGMKYLM